MDIPPEVVIKSSIRPGSVYYFPHEALTSLEPHFFVVINTNPITEQIILLVCSSSKIENVKRRNRDSLPETLVEVGQAQYSDFSRDSIFDCNNSVYPESIGGLIERLSNNTLKLKSEMDISLVEQLRKGVIASPQISITIKEQLGMKI